MFPGISESVNFEGDVSFAGSQRLTTREKKRARKNLGLNKDNLLNTFMDLVNIRAEEIYFSNFPIAENSLRFSFENLDYNPENSTFGTGGTWKKQNTLYTNIWDWTRDDPNWYRTYTFGAPVIGGNAFKPKSVTSLSEAFDYVDELTDEQYAVSFIEPCKILASETSNITSFKGTFQFAIGIKEIWKPFDFSSCTDASYMFNGCLNLTYVGGKKWVLPEALDTRNFMISCQSLKNMPEFDFPKSTTCYKAFMNCKMLEKFEKLNAPLATDFRDLFESDFRLVSVKDLGDTSNVKTWHDCFGGCISLRDLPQSIDLSSGEDCRGVFGYCFSLEKLPTLTFGNNVTSLENFCGCCSRLTEIPDNPVFHYVTNFSRFLSADDNFFNVPKHTNPPVPMAIKVLPSWYPEQATNVEDMFYGCKNVENGIYDLYLMLSNKITPVTNHKNCFEQCGVDTEEGRKQLDLVPDDWK